MHRVVPEFIIENYKAGVMRGEFQAVGLFLDLSGFSTMTDALMKHGQHGAEVLANLMHSVFDPLVDSIFSYGGKISSYAGDGITAFFSIDEDINKACLNALASAWLIQRRLVKNSQRHTVYGSFEFTVKIGLACGNISWGILRSEDGNAATYYFRGSVVDECSTAEQHAGAGQILISNDLYVLAEGLIQAEPSNGYHELTGFKVELPDTMPSTLPPVDLDVSRIFMPEDVIAHDAHGEFRQIVNLFMRFPHLTDDKLAEVSRVLFKLRKQYGGLLNRIDFGDKGCNMLMLWGAPVAFENDIARALNFILDLKSRVDVSITAGVTYYVAHAGYLGSVMCEDYTCYGWGVNLASRFMMNAPAGEVWIDDRIARRVANRFVFDYIGSQRFKGFSSEQSVYRLNSYNQNAESIYPGEMIGRDWEISQLEKFVDPIWRGEFAGALLVLGAAGIGKGRLVQGFRFSQVFESQQALWAVCQTEQILRQSFNPFRSWLFQYFDFASNQDTAARKEIFDSKLDLLIRSVPETDSVRELDRLRSVLGSLVDLTWTGSFYEQLDAEARYNSTLLALTSLIKVECLRQPLVLFVEDIQFIDDDSLHFLPRLKRSLSGGEEPFPVAIIATSRIENRNFTLENELVDEQMLLQGLPREVVARMVEILLGGAPSLDLIDLVMDRSEGNPYFIEQIIHYLLEERLIEMSSVGWIQVKRLHQSFLPGDIGALLVARLDQLSRKVKELVHTASVLGREFLVKVLAEITMEGDAFDQYVNMAERSAIWVGDDVGRYIFTHALLCDTAYSMQIQARRQELHSMAMYAIEKLFKDEMEFHFAELAYHAERAGLREKAVLYDSLAGKAARNAYQNSKGVEYLTRALSFTLEDELNIRFEILVQRVELFNRLGKRDRQLEDINFITKIAEQLQEDDRLAKAMMLRAAHSYFVGDFIHSIEQVRKAREYSPDLINSELGLYTLVVGFMSLLYLGKADKAMQHGQEALGLSRLAGNRKEEGRILTAIGLVALETNEPGSAIGYLEEAVAIAREVGDPSLEMKALINLAKAEGSLTGNYAHARSLYEYAHKLGRMVGDRHFESASLINMGFAAGMLGNFTSARTYYEQALSISFEIDSPLMVLYCRLNLSSLAGIQNQADVAMQQAQEAIALAQKNSQRSEEAWGFLYLGYAHSLKGELELAKDDFRKSLEIRNDLNQPAMSMEPIAGLVEVHLKADDLNSAKIDVETILEYLHAGNTLEGAEEPLRIYNACYSYLERVGDPRSQDVLSAARELLETQVSRFVDEESRNHYIENIPWRRAIRDAARS